MPQPHSTTLRLLRTTAEEEGEDAADEAPTAVVEEDKGVQDPPMPLLLHPQTQLAKLHLMIEKQGRVTNVSTARKKDTGLMNVAAPRKRIQ